MDDIINLIHCTNFGSKYQPNGIAGASVSSVIISFSNPEKIKLLKLRIKSVIFYFSTCILTLMMDFGWLKYIDVYKKYCSSESKNHPMACLF